MALLLCSVLASQAFSQDNENPYDSMPEPLKGHLNIGITWGLSSVAQRSEMENDTIHFPIVSVPIIELGYQYDLKDRISINSTFFVGFQSFRFFTPSVGSKGLFGDQGFAMPYFGARFQLMRYFSNRWYGAVGLEFQLNTTRKYDFNTTSQSAEAPFDSLFFVRDLWEYAGVQRGGSLAIGKEFRTGALRGIDLFLFYNYLDRSKLTIGYAADRRKYFTRVTYKGNVFGIGLKYHFLKQEQGNK